MLDTNLGQIREVQTLSTKGKEGILVCYSTVGDVAYYSFKTLLKAIASALKRDGKFHRALER